MTHFCRRVPPVIVRDLLQHALKGAQGAGQQNTEEQTHLRERQQRGFFLNLTLQAHEEEVGQRNQGHIASLSRLLNPGG